MNSNKEVLLDEMRKSPFLPITDNLPDIFQKYQEAIDDNNPDDISYLLFYKGIHYFRIGDFNHALNYWTHCVEAPKKKALKKLEASAYNYMGIIHGYMRQEAISQNDFLSGIRIAQKHHDYQELAVLYSNLGFLYLTVDDYDKAIKYEKKAIAIIDAHLKEDIHLRITCMAYLGIVYFKANQVAKSISIYNEIENLQQMENDVYISPAILNLAIRIRDCQQDDLAFRYNVQNFIASVKKEDEFLYNCDLFFDICRYLLVYNHENELRSVLDHMHRMSINIPLIFISHTIWEIEVAYAKKYGNDTIYLTAANQLLELFPAYEEEQRYAKLYSFDYVEHIHHTRTMSNQLEEKSKLDAMTGLLNKYTIQFLVEEYFAHNEKKKTSAMILVDMDHFKLVNDTLGHLVGDAIISETALVIKHYFGDSAFCGRIGGDEFLIFVKEVEDKDSLILQAELLREQIYGQIKEQNISVATQASLGIAFSNDENDTFESLYKEVDKALYRAKASGRNKITVAE